MQCGMRSNRTHADGSLYRCDVMFDDAQDRPCVAFLAKQDDMADWQQARKRFEKLQFHRKQRSGRNIWTCEATGPHGSRKLHANGSLARRLGFQPTVRTVYQAAEEKLL
ncbi:conjugal transfer nickase/helicase domain-containing protein [Pseudoxanthomonas putridarboris]|uniref:conjugal transfer nickase/helicase domain-containing protein n=1 Tax=Pseudoxanthomonas putridarboris TaxID=752605 RepID=UPI003CE54023